MKLGAGARLESQFIECQEQAEALVARGWETIGEKGLPYFVLATSDMVALVVAKKLDHQLVPLTSADCSQVADQ
jgi:hypothetical protein